MNDHAPQRTRRSPAGVREDKKRNCRDFLEEHGETLRSYAVSMVEAASRGSDGLAIMHTRQAWDIMLNLRSVAKDLAALDADLPPAGEGEAS